MRALPLMCALALLATGPAAARRHDPEKLPLTHVRDLHYGDVLFYFYQEKDLESLTRLLAYEHWGRMPHHEDDTRLLEGGCIWTSACTTRPDEIFQSVLTNDVPTGRAQQGVVLPGAGLVRARLFRQSRRRAAQDQRPHVPRP